MKAKIKHPEIVLRDNKPVAVILDMEEYQEMLERLGDLEIQECWMRCGENRLNSGNLRNF